MFKYCFQFYTNTYICTFIVRVHNKFGGHLVSFDLNLCFAREFFLLRKSNLKPPLGTLHAAYARFRLRIRLVCTYIYMVFFALFFVLLSF